MLELSEGFKCSSIVVVKCNLYLQNGRTALCIASWDGHEKIVQLLLRRKADVNHQTMVRFQLAWLAIVIACRVYIFVLGWFDSADDCISTRTHPYCEHAHG